MKTPVGTELRGPSRSFLARLAARAATFGERLGADFLPEASVDPAIARRRLDRWRELVARGDAERFARRLAWDGLGDAAALRGLGEVRFADLSRLPAWTCVVREASAAALRLDAAALATDPLLSAARARRTVHDVVLPFLIAARGRLRRATRARHALFSPAAHLAFEAALLARLCDHAERAVHAYRAGAEEETFATAVLADGLRGLLARYPVLARILAEDVLGWVDATAELLARLAGDREALGKRFGSGGDPGAVAAARAGLSDPHAGGRTVAILRFEDGTTAVYKPRPLRAERAFAGFVEWLEGAAGTPRLRSLEVLDRGTYGWCAYAEHADCADAAAVERYHERAGALLCLAYLLGAEDLHAENLVACGEHPILIDLEVLLRAAVRDEGIISPATAQQWKGGQHSVLAPGLLPVLFPLADGSLVEGGGLVRGTRGVANLPTLAGEPADGDPAPAVERGFRITFRAILEHRDALAAPGGPLEAFRGIRSRVLLRTTAIYASLLQRTLTPRFLESGAERSIELDILTRPLLRFPERHRLWPAVRDEARQMESMDVPVFHIDASSATLDTASGSVPEYAEAPGLERALRKLESLDPHEEETQAHCIRIAYASSRVRDGWGGRHTAAAALSPREAALQMAEETARWLAALAFPGEDAAPSWMMLGDGSIEDCGPGLAHGRTGIGLFLAALGSTGGAERHRRTSASVLGAVAATVAGAETAASLRERIGIGGAVGIGGVAWGLLRAGELLGDACLTDAAAGAVGALTPAAIAADQELDVFGGAAGALLGLLAVYGRNRDPLHLDAARACGAHLLAAREADPVTGLRAWRRAGDGELGTGFGHGAAGIAHALLRLHRVTGEPELRAAAAEAFAFEAALHVPEERRWHDRAGDRTTPPIGEPLRGWCHGAAGIGLARAAGLNVLDVPLVHADLRRALDACGGATATGPSSLCCGAMGRAELFLHAARSLGEPAWLERASQVAAGVFERGARRGTFAAGSLDSAFTPGLLQGISGIGYQVLRVQWPDRIPSVLLLE